MESASAVHSLPNQTPVSEPGEPDSTRLLTTCFERFYRTVYGYLVFRLFDRELAEELTAETFSQAATYIHDVTGDAQCIQAWLLRTAGNLATTHYRSRQRRPEIFCRQKYRRGSIDKGLRTGAFHALPPKGPRFQHVMFRTRGLLLLKRPPTGGPAFWLPARHRSHQTG